VLGISDLEIILAKMERISQLAKSVCLCASMLFDACVSAGGVSGKHF
jgi:hypothetical protein